MKNSRPFVIKTTRDILRVIKSIKRCIPKEPKGIYLVMPKKVFKKLLKKSITL